jgi:hypothetical protein
VDSTTAAGRRILLAGAQTLARLAAEALATEPTFPLVPAYRAGEQRGAPPCRHCAFLGVCRLEERELPPRLAASLYPRPETAGGG